MKPAIVTACAGLLACGALNEASASQLGIYGGGFYGNASKESQQGPYDNSASRRYVDYGLTPVASSATFDEKDSGYGFVVGYRLLANLAIEGGYMDIGTVSYRNDTTGTISTGATQSWRQNIDTNTSGITLAALGILPLSYEWEIYGRAGVLIASNDIDVYITNGPAFDRLHGSKSGFDLLGGAGISYSYADIYNLRLEYLRVFDAGEREAGPEGDVDMVTIGFTVSF